MQAPGTDRGRGLPRRARAAVTTESYKNDNRKKGITIIREVKRRARGTVYCGSFAGGGAARLAAVLAGESPADAILSLAS